MAKFAGRCPAVAVRNSCLGPDAYWILGGMETRTRALESLQSGKVAGAFSPARQGADPPRMGISLTAFISSAPPVLAICAP